MEENATHGPGAKDRVYLRILTSMPAKIYDGGRPIGKAIVNNLSSRGLSLSSKKGLDIPDVFDITLRLPWHLRKIKISLEAKNRADIQGIKKTGCRFTQIAPKDEEAISDYIRRSTEFHPACRLFSTAAFLLFLDALARIFIWSVCIYYKEAHTEYTFSVYNWRVYCIGLLLYGLCSFTACLYSCDIKRRRFILSMACGVFAFLFLLVKYAFYCKLRIWSSEYAPIKILFWIESVLVAYTAYATLYFIGSLKKIGSTADSLDAHSKVFREEKA